MTEPNWDGRTIIETERLVLRGFRRDDLAPFAEMHTDDEVMLYLGARHLPREVTDGIAAACQGGFERHGIAKLAVERKSDGAFLGMAGLSLEDWYPDDLEVGWRLARRYWGNGYAAEAGAAWLRYAFESLAAPRVISIADVPNARSIAVMHRIGLSFDHQAELPYEGSTFAAVVYSTTRDAWLRRER